MRIVHLVANLEIGGLERQVIELAAQQRASGHDAQIYCLFQDGYFAPEARSRNIQVTDFQKPPGASVTTIRRLAALVRHDRPHILHTHNAVVHHYGVAAAKCSLRQLRIINTQHGTTTLANDAKLSRIFVATLPWTNAVVAVSEEVRAYLVQNCGIPNRLTRVIRNGISLKRFEAIRAQPGSRLPVVRFGTLGRLVEAKDHKTLISAFAQVVLRIPSARLEIVGNGPLRQELENHIHKLGLVGKAHLLGARGDVGAFLSDLDIFVLSSRTEGLPVAILEAAAVGLPIVSTRVGGVCEVLNSSIAEYCEPGQADALAAAMLRMVNSDLVATGSRSLESARRFGIDQTWKQYQQLIQSFSVPRCA